MNYPCSCCHHYTRDQPSSNFDFEICPVCFWEDDPVQNIHPNSKSGANAISLAEAQDNYQQYGVSELRFLKHVRKPNDLETNDEKQNEHISKK